jgi:uncharacterized repeat protein (TIGR01451 family)
VTITLLVRNVGQYSAAEVFVTETLPEGFQYKWDSASLDNPFADAGFRANVTGANPYSFAVGRLPGDKELTLKYKALPISKK